MTGYLLVALGAAVGAPLRYLTDRLVQSLHRTRLPLGTFTVNVAGSFVLGALTGAVVPHQWMLLAGSGLCGALTTWSTLAFETVRLAEHWAKTVAIANIVVSVAVGFGAALLGQSLFR